LADIPQRPHHPSQDAESDLVCFAHRFDRSLEPDSDSSGELVPPPAWSSDDLVAITPGTTIAALRPKQAFLLLGELGVGKTWLFEHEAERLRLDHGAEAVFIRLGDFADERDLEQEAFNTPAVQRALGGAGSVYLFLDSLDQGLIRIPRLHHWLFRRCRDLKDSTNVRVRISSRMSPEAMSLGSRLHLLYSIPRSEIIYHLGPLTKSEVIVEAAARRLDGQRLVRLVSQRNAEVLAAHPLTLSLLLRTYDTTGRLEDDHRELYRDACRTLSAEHEPDHVLEAPIGSDLAYVLTTRLAALAAVEGAQLISSAPPSERPSGALGVESATSLPERYGMTTINVRDDDIRYVLTNAHFQLASPLTYRWSHMGLQDFMAAEWLASRLGPEQIRGLLVHPLDPKGQIRPELEEVAAWLAGMLPTIREYLLRVQPLVLLTSRSQAGALSDPDGLLQALLTPSNAMRVRWYNIRDFRLRRLRGRKTSGLIRSVLLRPESGADVQWLALAIVRQLRIRGLDAELFAVTTNRSTAEFVAVSAGLAIETVGSKSIREQLVHRLSESRACGLPDEVKASWLRATRKLLPVSTFLRVFTPPTDDMLGLYDTFDCRSFITRLTVWSFALLETEPISSRCRR
jgi:hypothetical protein